MSNFVKMKDIHLYVGFTAQALDCKEAIELLRLHKIDFTLLNYSADDAAHLANFNAMSTWQFGTEENGYKIQFDHYPILTWIECYDDWHTETHALMGIEAIRNWNKL